MMPRRTQRKSLNKHDFANSHVTLLDTSPNEINNDYLELNKIPRFHPKFLASSGFWHFPFFSFGLQSTLPSCANLCHELDCEEPWPVQVGQFLSTCEFGGLLEFACAILTRQGLNIVIFRRDLYKGTRQDTCKLIHIILGESKITSGSADVTYSEILGLCEYCLYFKRIFRLDDGGMASTVCLYFKKRK